MAHPGGVRPPHERAGDLIGPGRAEIVQRIESARDEGDLRENGGYHAAKEEQGKQEARIRQLQLLLRTAKVGEAPATEGVVSPGSVVTLRYPGDDDTMTFLLGSREAGDVDLEVYSPQSPLGSAVAGKRVGERPPTQCRTAARPPWRSCPRSRTPAESPAPPSRPRRRAARAAESPRPPSRPRAEAR